MSAYTGKLHKPLHLVRCLMICMMILCPASSRICNNGVRTIQLFSESTKWPVRIEGKRVVASSSLNYLDHVLQIVNIDQHYFLLYDPNANMFICWNKSYTNLMPRRNPRNLRNCKFDEKISIKHPTDRTRYTTTYTRNGKLKEIELKFNKGGNFTSPKLIRRCLEKKSTRVRHHTRHQNPKIDVEQLMNIDTLNITPETKKAYILLSKCADSDFVAKTVTQYDCSWGAFCDKMERIHKHHPIACELSNICQIKDNKRCA